MVSPPQEGESKRVAAEERLAACARQLEDMGAPLEVCSSWADGELSIFVSELFLVQ